MSRHFTALDWTCTTHNTITDQKSFPIFFTNIWFFLFYFVLRSTSADTHSWIKYVLCSQSNKKERHFLTIQATEHVYNVTAGADPAQISHVWWVCGSGVAVRRSVHPHTIHIFYTSAVTWRYNRQSSSRFHNYVSASHRLLAHPNSGA